VAENSKVNRLHGMVVHEVSLVDRAANKWRFLVVKRDKMAVELDDNGDGTATTKSDAELTSVSCSGCAHEVEAGAVNCSECGTTTGAAPSEKATWDTQYINDLPDSAFLYVAPGGEKDADGKTTPRSLRYFPVRDDSGAVDAAHAKDAIGRIPQSTAPGLSADDKTRLQDEARKLSEQATKATEKDATSDITDALEQIVAIATELLSSFSGDAGDAGEGGDTGSDGALAPTLDEQQTVQMRALCEKIDAVLTKGAAMTTKTDTTAGNETGTLALDALDKLLEGAVKAGSPPPAADGGNAPPPKKPTPPAPAPDPEAATKSDGALAKVLDVLDVVTKSTVELEQSIASLKKGESSSNALDTDQVGSEDFSWPLDMNRPNDKEEAAKTGTSFY